HAHIDMNWQWSWPETVAVTNDTFTTVLKLMDEFPDFCFTQSQGSVYEIARRFNPELFEQIRRRVAEGRWEIVAAQWVEGDKNLASGESLARHLLYTRRFFAEHFDLAPEDIPLDWEPDTFGHAHTIPTIVSHGAVKRYYMCRGGADRRPSLFWWAGPDGSRILVNLSTTWYNGETGPHNAIAMLEFCKQTGLKNWMHVYGVGDHGGGPTRRDIMRAIDMNTWPIYPNFRLATTREFYALAEKQADKLPVIDGELNFEFTGCYSSQSEIKKANRYGENYCVDAELAATLAYCALGRAYPGEALREAWIDTIFGHFHDILPGSCVAMARDYHLGQFQKTAAATTVICTESLRALAAKIDTSFAGESEAPPLTQYESMTMGAGVGYGTMYGGLSKATHVAGGPRTFVIFNPSAWQRDEVIPVAVWDFEVHETGRHKPFRIRTADGKTIAAQVTDGAYYWGHHVVDLAVPVSVGPMGYTTFSVEMGEADGTKQEAGVKIGSGYRGGEKQPIGDVYLENEFLAVTFDQLTGGIVKLLDKTTGVDLATPSDPLGVLEYTLERARTMSSWIVGGVKTRSLVELEELSPELLGPHVASILAKAKLNDSSMTIRYTLKAGQPWLDISVDMEWLERGGPDI
ncbi:MAG: hypothetical protein KAU28_07460, partial [Phycisphaerae bacterium]|nr:hypothetical protein [Phycisphaerae bacterium]